MMARYVRNATCFALLAQAALFLMCLALCRCTTPELAIPRVAGAGVVETSPDHTGFLITQAKRDYLVKNGCSSSLFTRQGNLYYLSGENEVLCADQLLKVRNPGVVK